jgi:thiol-disulfide isomerase/thioredoxin
MMLIPRKNAKRALPVVALATLLLISAGVAGCGNTDSEAISEPPDYERLLADSPDELARLHLQGDELLDGGEEAFAARLEALSGYPVVVNVWASWCGPCREEFPLFQEQSAALGREVAFLGVNFQDDPDAAATFLESYPVPYPSYLDPDAAITESLGAGKGLPATVFFDRSGKQTYTKYGPYRSAREFRADIARFAERGGPPSDSVRAG